MGGREGERRVSCLQKDFVSQVWTGGGWAIQLLTACTNRQRAEISSFHEVSLNFRRRAAGCGGAPEIPVWQYVTLLHVCVGTLTPQGSDWSRCVVYVCVCVSLSLSLQTCVRVARGDWLAVLSCVRGGDQWDSLLLLGGVCFLFLLRCCFLCVCARPSMFVQGLMSLLLFVCVC